MTGDKQQEKERDFYRALLCFQGSFATVGDAPGAIAAVVNGDGFLPLTANADVYETCARFAKLLPLKNRGQSVTLSYRVFWNEDGDATVTSAAQLLAQELSAAE